MALERYLQVCAIRVRGSWRHQDSDTSDAAPSPHCASGRWNIPSTALSQRFPYAPQLFPSRFLKYLHSTALLEQSVQGITPVFFREAVVNPVQDREADGGVIWTSRVQNDHVYMRALETVTCLPSSSIEQVIGCGGAGHEANGILGKGGCLSQIRNRSSRIRRAETARPRPSMKKCSCTSTREACTRVTRPCVRSVRDPGE